MTRDGDCGEQDCDEGCSHKPKLKNIRIEVGWLSPSFSRQAKASELSLVFWLNENVRIVLPDGLYCLTVEGVLSDSYDADMSRSVY